MMPNCLFLLPLGLFPLGSWGFDIHDLLSPFSSVSYVSTLQVLLLHIFGDTI